MRLSNVEKIVVGFSRPKKWKPFAWLIMVGYGIPYDHVYVRMHSDSYERDIIYQASKSMINFMGTTVFEADNIIVKEFQVDISTENKKALMQFAIDNAGKPYSIKEAVGLAWVRINALFGRKITNPFKDGTNGYVCSVLADYILDHYTTVKVPGDFEDADPRFLYDYLDSYLD